LRKYLEDNGFEVGIHGLNHDGKLFSNKRIFDERSKKINDYIKKWNVLGFRAPAMHHNLEWLKQLDIEYDLSTFDTDPFEPQSDGVGTIFPFLVTRNSGKEPYIEMPYTLVQDFTLFILMKEKDSSIWEKKLDWIAENSGVAILNVHPDYINFENKTSLEEYPIKYYTDFLKFIKQNYSNNYWNVLPRQLSSFWRQNANNTKI
jgi:peptidoglycan/xylan/chitin deacetylase (PgdA/CDA1 family)